MRMRWFVIGLLLGVAIGRQRELSRLRDQLAAAIDAALRIGIAPA